MYLEYAMKHDNFLFVYGMRRKELKDSGMENDAFMVVFSSRNLKTAHRMREEVGGGRGDTTHAQLGQGVAGSPSKVYELLNTNILFGGLEDSGRVAVFVGICIFRTLVAIFSAFTSVFCWISHGSLGKWQLPSESHVKFRCNR